MKRLMHDNPELDRTPFAGFPLGDADQCVKCGLCLPHCPTYKLSRHEGDSPRGRIALMQGLARGDIDAEGSALPHLDGCLVCRACETVCPADVPYGRLIDAGRTGLWRSGHRPGWMWRMLAFWRRTPRRLRWLNRGLRFLAVSRLARTIARLPLGRVSRANAFIERTGTTPRNGTHGRGTRGNVSLFLGCIARSLDAETLNATVRVLDVMGFRVTVPEDQACCGAMDAHAGDTHAARALAKANVKAFPGTDTVISTASGCGVQLQDYAALDDDGREFSLRVHDVMQFIARHADALPPLRHAPARVAVHAPCTLRNGMREHGALEVLGRIAAIDVRPLQHADCCGAAGTYLFEHVESADRLGERLLDALAADLPDILVTSNIGCALHVRRLAAARGLSLRVMHPVALLAASLPAAAG